MCCHSSRVNAEHTTESAFVRNFLIAFNGSYLIESLNVRRQSSMYTQDAFVDDLLRHTTDNQLSFTFQFNFSFIGNTLVSVLLPVMA